MSPMNVMPAPCFVSQFQSAVPIARSMRRRPSGPLQSSGRSSGYDCSQKCSRMPASASTASPAAARRRQPRGQPPKRAAGAEGEDEVALVQNKRRVAQVEGRVEQPRRQRRLGNAGRSQRRHDDRAGAVGSGCPDEPWRQHERRRQGRRRERAQTPRAPRQDAEDIVQSQEEGVRHRRVVRQDAPREAHESEAGPAGIARPPARDVERQRGEDEQRRLQLGPGVGRVLHEHRREHHHEGQQPRHARPVREQTRHQQRRDEREQAQKRRGQLVHREPPARERHQLRREGVHQRWPCRQRRSGEQGVERQRAGEGPHRPGKNDEARDGAGEQEQRTGQRVQPQREDGE